MNEVKVKKNRYAWVIMIVCCFASICGVGLVSNTYGVFLPPIMKDLGFGAGQAFLILTIQSFSTVFFYSLGAKCLEKYNARIVTTIAGVIIAIALYFFTLANAIWHFYIIAAVLGAIGAFAALNIVPLLINRWFIKHKNLAVGISYTFTGLAGALFNPLFASISNLHGWRTGYFVAALIALSYPIVAIIFVRNKPADLGLKPYGIEESEEMKDIANQIEIKEYPGIPSKYAFKTFAFWVSLIFIITNCFCTGFNQHWVNLGVVYGYDLVASSTLATVALLSAAILMIVAGWVNDKIGVMKSSIIFTFCGIISMIILMIDNGKNFALIQLSCIFFGGAVAITPIQPSMTIREIFGMRSFTILYPVAMMALSFGTGVTYTLHGVLIQVTGSYMGSYIFNLVSYIIGLIAVLLVMRVTKSTKEKYWREVGQTI